MQLTEHKGTGDLHRFEVAGDMTIYTAADDKRALLERWHALLDQGSELSGLELDLAHVGDFDTAGVQNLLLLCREAQREDAAVRVTGSSDTVRDVVELYRLAELGYVATNQPGQD